MESKSDLPTPEQFAERLLRIPSSALGAAHHIDHVAALIASRDRALLAPFVALARQLALPSAPVTDHAKGYYQARYEVAEQLRAAITAARGGNQPKE